MGLNDVDIKQRLGSMKIPYHEMQSGDGNDGTGARVRLMRTGFAELNQKQDFNGFYHRKRTVVAVDYRTKRREFENVYMFQPPQNARDIPKDEVPEWYLHSTSNQVIPGKRPIGAAEERGGSLLTLSIHAKQQDVVKAYLYWNGGVMRFMPEDIRTVLPLIFNMKNEKNTAFLTNEKVELTINKMARYLVDYEFEAFQTRRVEEVKTED